LHRILDPLNTRPLLGFARNTWAVFNANTGLIFSAIQHTETFVGLFRWQKVSVISISRVDINLHCLSDQVELLHLSDLMAVMSKLDKYRVLIIDDIGYVKKTNSETQVLFEFIAHRYESGSLIITSNQLFSYWDQIFPDTLMTVAAIDRIIHHATILEIDGDSYRRKRQKKS